MARRNLPPRGPQIELCGGELAIAFGNTASARPDNAQQGVASFGDLLTWGQQAGVLSALEGERLERLAAERPEDAAAVVVRAQRVRSSLRRIFYAVAAKKEFPREDLKTLNDVMTRSLPAPRIVPGPEGLTWGWTGDEDALDRMLWSVLHSAALFLTSERIQGVRQCAGWNCNLYFFDKTGRRKWCSMKTCGNRAKSLNYYYYKSGKDKRERIDLMPERHRRNRRAPSRERVS